jgi:hypothetical protein
MLFAIQQASAQFLEFVDCARVVQVSKAFDWIPILTSAQRDKRLNTRIMVTNAHAAWLRRYRMHLYRQYFQIYGNQSRVLDLISAHKVKSIQCVSFAETTNIPKCQKLKLYGCHKMTVTNDDLQSFALGGIVCHSREEITHILHQLPITLQKLGILGEEFDCACLPHFPHLAKLTWFNRNSSPCTHRLAQTCPNLKCLKIHSYYPKLSKENEDRIRQTIVLDVRVLQLKSLEFIGDHANLHLKWCSKSASYISFT